MTFRHDLKDMAPGPLTSLLWDVEHDKQRVVGSPANEIYPTHPVLNIRTDKVRKAFVHFYGKAAQDIIEEVDIELIRT